MNKLFGLLLLALACWAPGVAQAAACFWVGGTGTWDNTNTGGGGAGGIKWASASGGTSACAGGGTGGSPTSADSVTFDANSGGGTVTVAASIGGTNTIGTLTAGAFTGTLDFSVNNPSITAPALAISGTGARKFLMGTGTFTLTNTSGNVFDLTTTTNLDGTSNFAANYTITGATAGTRNFVGAGKTFGTLTVSANSSRGQLSLSGANTFNSIVIGDGNNIALPAGVTTTATNGVTGSGSSANSTISVATGSIGGGIATLSSAVGATLTYAIVYGVTSAGGGTFSATSSFDQGRNTGWTITGPSGSSGGRIIGG